MTRADIRYGAERTGAASARLYSAFGRVIESDLVLTSLLPASAGEPLLSVQYGWNGKRNGHAQRPVYDLVDGSGRFVYRLEMADDLYVWTYPEAARFEITRNGRSVRWESEDGKEPDAASIVTGPVLGFALQLLGHTALHGSALALDGRSVGLLAPSGHGKSTLAVKLMARGLQLVTDDVILLEEAKGGFQIIPSYPQLKLWPDTLELASLDTDDNLRFHVSWADKRVVGAQRLGAVSTNPQRLAASFLLAPVDPHAPVEVKELRGRDALALLVAQGYNAQLLAEEREILARQMAVLADVCEKTPVYVLTCPRAFERLDDVADAIISTISARSAAGD